MKALRSADIVPGLEPLPRPDGVRQVFFDYIRNPAFKRLLDRVASAQERERLGSIAVLSEQSGEGKTFLISVLALGYAMFLRKRVLIMDTISQSRSDSFYMDALLEPPTGSSSTLPAAQYAGAIDLITTRNLKKQYHSGPETRRGAVQLVSSAPDDFDTADFQIGAFIAALKPSYDLILLDTCALGEVSRFTLDPVILSKQADAAILVTSPKSLSGKGLARAQTDLEGAGVKLLGMIHNAGIV